MAQPKFTLYKYVKLGDGNWRYCKAALYSNGKIKRNIVLVEGKEREFAEGEYFVNYNNKWIPVGGDALEAQRKRSAMLEETAHIIPPETAASNGSLTLAEAVDQYFKNLECRDCDPKTIRAYRSAVDPFVAQRWCEATDKTPSRPKKQYIDQIDKQDVLDFMGWLKKQPRAARKHSNPERTRNNKIGHVAIFLKAFGKTKLLKTSEYPKYHEKKVVAHPDEELAILYGAADPEETFLLDFFIGSMAREDEGARCKYTDLTGTTLTIYGKQNKTRTVEISPRLAALIRERRKRSTSEYIFPNRKGEPNKHLLRKLQNLAKKAEAKFHTELHKLRKTGASRRYAANPAGLMTLMHELGHESLETTQAYG